MAAAAFGVVAVVLVLAGCRQRGDTATATTAATAPSATQAATATVQQGASATVPSAGATQTPGRASLDDQLDLIERRVEEVRGLRPEGETRRRFVDSAGIASAIDEELDKPEIQEQIAREQKLYRLLGLIPQDADLDRLYRGLLGSQVLGLYDSETEEFLVLLTGSELSALAESTYAHEYAHRLQDVRFDLDKLSDAAGDNGDRQIAVSALIEGDATVTQLGYGLRYMSRARLSELLQAPEQFAPPPADTPFILLQSLEFPYTVGAQFIASLRGNTPGFETVDRAFANPPSTSEQVMHPDKYRSGEGAAAAGIPDLAGVLGPDWTPGKPEVLGEFLLKTWLSFLQRGDAATAAAGWGGDSCVVYDGPGGQVALAARIVWDRPEEDGAEFFESLVAGLDRAPGLRRAAGSTAVSVVWEGAGHSIGARLGRGGAGVFVAAGPGPEIVTRLLDGASR